MHNGVQLASMPAPMDWAVAPAAWEHSPEMLSVTAAAHTDLFCNPDGSTPQLDAARLLCPIGGDFQLSARVDVQWAATFDAGALLLWSSETSWAKLCFEYSPQREPMVVSVVTSVRSDDANGFVHRGGAVYLRISRIGQAVAFHASIDGRVWQLVRHFALDLGQQPKIGFLAQSPTGHGARVVFDRIAFQRRSLADLRSGE